MGLTSLLLFLPLSFPPSDPQGCQSLQDLLYFILWSLVNTQSAEEVIGDSKVKNFPNIQRLQFTDLTETPSDCININQNSFLILYCIPSNSAFRDLYEEANKGQL